ncbi:hypothetical protein M9458_043283, partial [Cirrhinus mrigala]
MDPVSHLLRLHQGNRPIKDYVVDFCQFCHLVNFNDVALKDIFRAGLTHPIRFGLPGGKIHWSLEKYIDYALLLARSSFTVGIADEGPRNPTVTPTPQPVRVMPAKSKPVQVTSTKPQPAHVTSAKPQPALVKSTKPEPSHAKSVKAKPAHAMPAAPGPAHAMPAAPESAPVMAARPEPEPVMATLPQPAHKMAAIPKPIHKMAAISKPVHKMAAPSESLAKMAATPEPHQATIISSAFHPIISATPK